MIKLKIKTAQGEINGSFETFKDIENKLRKEKDYHTEAKLVLGYNGKFLPLDNSAVKDYFKENDTINVFELGDDV